MTPCFSLRSAPPLALLLATTSLLPACVDPKTIGQETETADSGATEGGTDDATDGMTSQGPASATDPTASETDPTASETEGMSCPPIDPAPCTECTCIDGAWSCEPSDDCAPSCVDQACGAPCAICADDDLECNEPLDQGICTATGECVGTPPPELGFCEGALQPGFEGELDVVSGCADLQIYARDMADERALVVMITQSLAADAIASDMPVHVELDATDPAVELEGRAGFFVTANECTDVIFKDPDIKETWLPNAGTVIVDITPTGDGLATATMQLVDVELYRINPGPAPLVVNVTFADVSVGWFPG